MQYFIGKNGQQLGPFGEEQIKARVASGEFANTDLMWKEGMEKWEPIGTVLNNPYAPSAVLGDSPLLTSQMGQMRLAGAGARLGAVMLNSLFSLLVALPGMIMIGVGMAQAQSGGAAYAEAVTEFPVLSIVGFGVVGVGLIAWFIYQLNLYLKTGQTKGKKIMRVRVVRFTDGGNPGFVGLVVMREILLAVIGLVPLVGSLFQLVNVCFIFRADRRCIHDLMANTKVVEV